MKTARNPVTVAAFLLLIFAISAPLTQANFSGYNSADHSSNFFYTLKPNQSINGQLTVINLENQKTHLGIYGADATMTTQGDFTLKTIDQEQLNVGKWIKITKPELTLQPFEKKKVDFIIKVPEKTPPGDYAGGFAISTIADPSNKKGGTGLTSISRVVIKTIIKVPGEKIHRFRWENFSHLEDTRSGHQFDLTFENTGNTSIIGEGYVEVTGGPDDANTIKFNNLNLFQNDNFTLALKWPQKPLYGNFKATAHVTFWEYDIKSGNKLNPKTLSKTLEFSIWPWPYIWLALGIFAVGATILAAHSIYHSNIRKKAETYIVQNNETLTKIALDHKTDWKKLAELNKIKPPYDLQEGQKILIPFRKK